MLSTRSAWHRASAAIVSTDAGEEARAIVCIRTSPMTRDRFTGNLLVKGVTDKFAASTIPRAG